jgi:hypothetical protein
MFPFKSEPINLDFKIKRNAEVWYKSSSNLPAEKANYVKKVCFARSARSAMLFIRLLGHKEAIYVHYSQVWTREGDK